MFFIDYFRSLAKRRAIRSYARRLPRLLAKDYGHSKSYTPQQVRRTIERYRLNSNYSCYGVAMFSDRDDFTAFHQQIGQSCDYDVMQGEIADLHFQGNSDFTTTDVSACSDAGGGHGGDGHSSGGDGGGGGDW
jgi:hypothetical protein